MKRLSLLTIFLLTSIFLVSCASKNISLSNVSKEAARIENEKDEYFDFFSYIDSNTLPDIPSGIYEAYLYDISSGEKLGYNEFKEFNIPPVMAPRVSRYIDFFTKRVPDTMQMWLERSNKYVKIVREIFAKENIPQDLVVLAFTESGYNNLAISRSGAVGMWQFMPSTGKLYGMKQNFWLDERRDFEQATTAAARYLKDLHSMFNDWYLALASYNGGPGRISGAIRRNNAQGLEDLIDLGSKSNLHIETRDYVPKFLAQLIIYKNYLKYGFSTPTNSPVTFSKVEAPAYTNLIWLADKLNISYNELRDLNPALILPMTPPTPYTIRLPNLLAKKAEDILQAATDIERSQYIVYNATAGESLNNIAKKFDVSIDEVARLNSIRMASLFKSRPIFIPTKHSLSASIMNKHFAESLVSIEPKYYKVKRGDNFIGIAHKFRMRLHQLQALNPGVKPNRIYPGQLLAISKDGYGTFSSTEATKPAPKKATTNKNISTVSSNDKRKVANKTVKYKVKRGDTLWSIATKHSTSVAMIESLNKLKKNSRLYVGKTLTIRVGVR